MRVSPMATIMIIRSLRDLPLAYLRETAADALPFCPIRDGHAWQGANYGSGHHACMHACRRARSATTATIQACCGLICKGDLHASQSSIPLSLTLQRTLNRRLDTCHRIPVTVLERLGGILQRCVCVKYLCPLSSKLGVNIKEFCYMFVCVRCICITPRLNPYNTCASIYFVYTLFPLFTYAYIYQSLRAGLWHLIVPFVAGGGRMGLPPPTTGAGTGTGAGAELLPALPLPV